MSVVTVSHMTFALVTVCVHAETVDAEKVTRLKLQTFCFSAPHSLCSPAFWPTPSHSFSFSFGSEGAVCSPATGTSRLLMVAVEEVEELARILLSLKLTCLVWFLD